MLTSVAFQDRGGYAVSDQEVRRKCRWLSSSSINLRSSDFGNRSTRVRGRHDNSLVLVMNGDEMTAWALQFILMMVSELCGSDGEWHTISIPT